MLIHPQSIEAIDFWYNHFGHQLIKREPLDDGVTRNCAGCGRESSTLFRIGPARNNYHKCPACYSFSCGAPKQGLRILTGSVVIVRPNRKSLLVTRPTPRPANWIINREEVGGVLAWTGKTILNPPPPPYILVHLGRDRDLQRLRITHGRDTLHYCNGGVFPIDLPLVRQLAEELHLIRNRWARLRKLLEQEQFIDHAPFPGKKRHPEILKLETEQPRLADSLRNFPPGRGHWMALNCIFKHLQFQEQS